MKLKRLKWMEKVLETNRQIVGGWKRSDLKIWFVWILDIYEGTQRLSWDGVGIWGFKWVYRKGGFVGLCKGRGGRSNIVLKMENMKMKMQPS